MIPVISGHSYGGQCLCIRGSILYSGSMDKTVRSWSLGPDEEKEEEGEAAEQVKFARWQNLIPYFPWIAPWWRVGPGAQSKERKGSNFHRSVAEP